MILPIENEDRLTSNVMNVKSSVLPFGGTELSFSRRFVRISEKSCLDHIVDTGGRNGTMIESCIKNQAAACHCDVVMIILLRGRHTGPYTVQIARRKRQIREAHRPSGR